METTERIDRIEEGFATRTAHMDRDLKKLTEKVEVLDHILNDKGRGYCRRVDALEARLDDARTPAVRLRVIEDQVERIEKHLFRSLNLIGIGFVLVFIALLLS